jgi:hypothetical protein
MIWFPKGFLNSDWFMTLCIAKYWYTVWRILTVVYWNKYDWYFDIVHHVGILKLQHFWDNMSLSSSREERWELYPLGPTGSCCHWYTLGLMTGTARWDTQQSTLRWRWIHSPVQCIFNKPKWWTVFETNEFKSYRFWGTFSIHNVPWVGFTHIFRWLACFFIVFIFQC